MVVAMSRLVPFNEFELIEIISYRKSTLPKSAKTSDVGMHFHQKTLPQKPMKQVTMPTAMRAQTTHTSQRNAFIA